jgi:ribosome maturation factor RimP
MYNNLRSSDIRSLVENYFEEENLQDCFYVSDRVTGNKIEVFIDSDTGISFLLCRKVSRVIEAVIDETQEFGEKYTLDVSSPGVGSPLTSVRQYKKNVGRNIKVKHNDQKTEGKLVAATEEGITVFYIEVVKEGKKKKKLEINKEIMYSDIREASIKISFK